MIEPYNTGFIYATTAAGTVHEIYYEQCGNPQVPARRTAGAERTAGCADGRHPRCCACMHGRQHVVLLLPDRASRW